MDDQNLKDLEREQADNQLIGDAFQHLLDTYLSSRHRKKVDIVTKAFNFARQAHKGVGVDRSQKNSWVKVCAASRANHISCTLSPWLR